MSEVIFYGSAVFLGLVIGLSAWAVLQGRYSPSREQHTWATRDAEHFKRAFEATRIFPMPKAPESPDIRNIRSLDFVLFNTPEPSDDLLIRGSSNIWDMESLLTPPGEDCLASEAKISGVGYKGVQGIIFQASRIHQFPPGFKIRGGYNYYARNPFERDREEVRGGISFHPQARGIVSA